MKIEAGQTRMILDPTFKKLLNEAVDKGHEAMRAYGRLGSEDRTPKAANAAARAMKEAGAPLQKHVRKLRDQVRLIRGIKSFNRLARKLGREEVPVPKMM